MTRFFISLLFLSILLNGCTNNRNGSRKDEDPDVVFFDYKIKGEEKDSDVTVYIQFRMDGSNGTTLVLDDPAKVQLDGETISVDSAKLTGAYYEIRKPLDSFTGKHTIIFTDLDKKEYKEEFEFQPLILKTEIPAVIYRGDISFDLEGVKAEDYIRVTATDTSFYSRDINEIDMVINGKLTIPAKRVKNLVNGPITLLLSRETEKLIKNGTKVGGRIVVSYVLQREFELADSVK